MVELSFKISVSIQNVYTNKKKWILRGNNNVYPTSAAEHGISLNIYVPL